MEKINAREHVIHTSPFIFGQAMLSHGKAARGVVVRGIVPEYEIKTTDILKNIQKGNGNIKGLNEYDPFPGVIVGNEVANALGLITGDVVNVISPVAKVGPLGMLPKMKKFKVVAVFEAGMYDYDANLVYIHLKQAQSFFDMPDEVTGIEIKVDYIYRAKEMAKEIQDNLGFPYYAKDWMDMNRNLFAALKLEKLVMFVILCLIVFVASFNIISNLVMIVFEKSREIAILKAMGATDQGVMTIFMLYGLIIGVVGTVSGLIGGYGACVFIKTSEIIKLQPDVYYLDHLPVNMSPYDFIYVAIAAISISFSATIYPSWQAARMNPVEPLRYE
jgi:lipoprotein-releasing system permease protein